MKYLFILCLIIMISSCTRIETKRNIKPTILEYFDIDTSWHYVNKKFHTCFEDSINSYLELRCSTKGTFYQPNRYLFLKYNGISWKGIVGLRPMIVGESSFEKDIAPKNGWKSFEDSLISIDVNSICFKDSEKDSIDKIIDGEFFYLEIITPNLYKIYSYHEPEELIRKCKKSKSLIKFKKLFNLINDNFNDYYKEKR